MKGKRLQKIIAFVLIAALLPWNALPVDTIQAAETVVPTPAYEWNFEEVTGSSIANSGSTDNGDATLKGTAGIVTGQLTKDGKNYSDASNKVLDLGGGNKGTSYVDLPKDLYSGVSASTGFTWSFWMKTATDVVSYSRILSSTNSSNGQEFAYAPYAADAVWNLIFDDGTQYMHIYGSEPAKNVWNYITFTVSGEEVVFYVNGNEVASSCGKGSASVLKDRLNGIASFTNHALGRTYSTWSDKDCKAQLDDVAMYKKALTAAEVAAIAKSYGLEPEEPWQPQDAREGVYGSEEVELTLVPELTRSSADGKITVKIWKDTEDRYYYSVSRAGKVVIECSALGIMTKTEDLTTGLKLVDYSYSDNILDGGNQTEKLFAQMALNLEKGDARLTIIFRLYEDGIGYRYVVDGDDTKTTETTVVTGEASEFMLPDKGTIWTVPWSQTYEGIEYTKRSMADQYAAKTVYSTPILASLTEDSGNSWVLLAEANVYNEEKPYCASVFETKSGSKSMQVRFGKYLVQETDESKDKSRYSASYADIKEVTMENEFQTPWRVAIIGEDLEEVTNSSLVMDLNPEPEGDFSWVEPGASVWSWWSSSYDAIQYSTMIDYIDFAAETGMKYCLVDYGWELWDDFRNKIASLVEYADEKGVGILVWYGVNKFDGDHIFDLDSTEAIEEEFAWCEEVGIKGVKVDYINSDSQFAMKIMYDLADIAADHHLVLNYHGCTNPRGENRTYPNILSSEAVAGMENFKWNNGPSVTSMLTLPYTRNVLGPMEFTPTAYRVHSSDATAGFMLAQSVVYESTVQTFAQSAYNYPGYNGLSLIVDVPASWDESRLLGGYPGESVIRARRSGENWFLGAMTAEAAIYDVKLDFLEAGEIYNAYIYNDNKAGDDIEVTTQRVTANDVLSLKLMKNGGCGIKFSKTEAMGRTEYDDYTYYEAETKGTFAGEVKVSDNQYASNLKTVGYVGGKANNTLTFKNIEVAEAGEYKLRVYYVTGAERSVYIRVNNEDEYALENIIANANDWKATCSKEVTIYLQEGKNEICLFNNNAYAPDIDRIAVSKTDISNAAITLEADSYLYTGKEITPKVSVKRSGVTLVQDEEYTVTYIQNLNAGTAKVVVTGTGLYGGQVEKTFTIKAPEVEKPAPQPGEIYEQGNFRYKVTKAVTKTTAGEAALVKVTSKKAKKVTMPASVQIEEYTYNITSVKANVCSTNKKVVTTFIVGKNVTAIEKNAFKSCKKLKSIQIKSTVLKSVGKNAFKGISSKAKIKVPKKQFKAYKKLLKNKGQKKTVKITK